MNSNGARFVTYMNRSRDCLVITGDARPLHQELDMHFLSCGIQHESFVVQLLRDGLSAMALYVVSRPRFDSFGWTINIQEPIVNLFFTGSEVANTVIGRAFLENIQPSHSNLFIAQTKRPHGPLQNSSIEVEGSNLFRIVEQYCSKSDQQKVRFFCEESSESNNATDVSRVGLVVAFPNADRKWIQALTDKEVFQAEENTELKFLVERFVTYRCGCDSDWITKTLVDLYKDSPEELFQGDQEVEAECPRCGANHKIDKKMFNMQLSEAGGEGKN